jgi:hypothetical protein
MPSKILEVGCEIEKVRWLSNQSRVAEKTQWFGKVCTLK